MFGNTSNNTFGSSSFGGFGSNNNNNAQQQQQGGLFGNKSTFGATNTGFGSTSTFGGTPNNSTSGGLFGAKPAASSGLFGASNTSFGGGSSFGATNTTSAFGGGGTSLFGNNNAASTSSGGLFGSAGGTTGFSSSNSLFGGTSTSTNAGGSSLFGGTSTGFGSTQQNGTNIQFNPVVTNDTLVVKGQSTTVQVKQQVITCMKEYENKSMEELRCEDYLAGRKSGNTTGTTQPTQPATGGLFGATNANTTNNTPSFGGFGSTANNATSGGLFGSTNNTATSGGLFGSNTANKPTGLFGSTASTGTKSLFGATNTANPTNTFGSTGFGSTTTNNAFGSTNTGSTGLFGSTNNTANKPNSLFGATNTGTTGGLFGNTNTNNTTGSSLFGATNTGATSGGLFGNTATSATGGGLFGNTANKSSFGGFGSTTTNTLGTGGGLFGNTSNTAAKPAFSLGGTTGGSSLFGNTGNSFSSTNTGSSLFGSTANKTGSSFGGFGTTNTGSMFGGTNTLTANNNAQPVLGASLDSTHIHSVVAALSSTPFGDSPLFRNALSEHQKLKPTTPPPASVNSSKSRINPKLSNARPKPFSYNQLFEGLEDDISPSPEAFLPRNSLKKLVLQSNKYSEPETPDLDYHHTTSSAEPEQSTAADMTTNLPPPPAEEPASDNRNLLNTTPLKLSPISRKLPFDVDTPAPTTNINPRNSWKLERTTPPREITTPPKDRSIIENTMQDIEEEEPLVGLDGKPLKTPAPTLPFTLSRPEYYTIPGCNELADLVKDDSLVVKDLIIGRAGYGEVKFLGEVDLYGMDLDKTVFFRRKEIVVYPDDSVKPPQGQGLNRRSEVTLECVYPTDKGTKENVTDAKEIIRRGFPAYLEKKTFKMGAKFIEYRPESGQWTFMVKHFSQYGLLDDSDEEEVVDVKRMKQESPIDFGEEDGGTDDVIFEEPAEEEEEEEEEEKPRMNNSTVIVRKMDGYEGYKEGLFGFNESEEEDEQEEEMDNLFGESHFNYSSSLLLTKKGPFTKTALKMEKLETSDVSEEKKAAREIKPAAPVKSFGVSIAPSILSLPPLSQSIAAGHTHFKLDMGLSRHFGYRSCISSSGRIVSKSASIGGKKSNTSVFDSHTTTSGTFSRLQIGRIGCGTTPEQHHPLLDAQLEHTLWDDETSAQPSGGHAALDELVEVLGGLQDEESVLKSALLLCRALWADEGDAEGSHYGELQYRRSNLESWLGDELRMVAKERTLEFSKLGVSHLPAVLAWLAARGTQEACEILCKAGDFQLALLVSQSSTPVVRQLVLKQLQQWKENGSDALISDDRLRIYVLLSGEQIWESSTKTINVCEDMDWMSSFALFLRFLPPSAPLQQAVLMYKEAFEAGMVAAPVVTEEEDYSVFWELLLLYCNPAHPLSHVLNNQGITPNILNERDTWFLWTTLHSLGLPPTSPHLAAKITANYAAQLERLGLISWCVFVLRHLPGGGTTAVSHVIQRSQGDRTEETFCVGRLRVPREVFSGARALAAGFREDWECVVLELCDAQQYIQAHSTFLERLATQKIVSREEEVLTCCLERLHSHKHYIPQWDTGAGVYHGYLGLPSQLPSSEEELETLRANVSEVGATLNHLPYTKLTEICAVDMMGLRTATLLVHIWKALFQESENRELLLTMKTFPMPSDYWLHDVISKLSSEIIAGEEGTVLG